MNGYGILAVIGLDQLGIIRHTLADSAFESLAGESFETGAYFSFVGRIIRLVDAECLRGNSR
jgi:hypothetical protein